MNIMSLKLNDIFIEENSRGKVENLTSLMKSIKENGLLQPVIVFKQKGNSKFKLIAGNRRFHAIQKLGLKTINAHVLDDELNSEDELLLNLVENLQRTNVSMAEEGRIINLLVEKYKMHQSEIAVRLSVTLQYVQKALTIFNNIPKKYHDKIIYSRQNKQINSGKISVDTALKVNSLTEVSLKNKELLYDGLLTGEVIPTSINKIARLIKSGKTFSEAKSMLGEIHLYRVNLLLSREEMAEAKKSSDINDSSLLIEAILSRKFDFKFSQTREFKNRGKIRALSKSFLKSEEVVQRALYDEPTTKG